MMCRPTYASVADPEDFPAFSWVLEEWLTGWLVVVCLSGVRSQPASGWLTVGLVDRSVECQEYGMERR